MDICRTFNVPPSVIGAVKRIIAIGDIHGDFTFLIFLLKIARVIDYKNENDYEWIGGETHVVQLGDQIDNCRPTNFLCSEQKNSPNDRAEDTKIIDFMYELDIRAQKMGGRVISLLGNHELLNLSGEMSYVSHKNIQEFGTVKERIKSFSSKGKYGKKLICTHPTAIIIGSNLFVHAGILPDVLEILPNLKNIVDEYSTDTHELNNSKKNDDIIREFILKCLRGDINKRDVISLIFSSGNTKYLKFLEIIFKGSSRSVAENNIDRIMQLINKLPKLKEIFIKNIYKLESAVESRPMNEIEIINHVIKQWLMGNVSNKHNDEIQKLNSLFWTRIFGGLPKNELAASNNTCKTMVQPILKTFNVRNLIIAHTPQFDANQVGINATCVDAQIPTKPFDNGDCINENSKQGVWRVDIGGAETFNKFDSEYIKTSKVSQARRPQVLEILNDSCFNILY